MALQREPFLMMFCTINLSPLLVTKKGFMPIIILSKYQKCPLPLSSLKATLVSLPEILNYNNCLQKCNRVTEHWTWFAVRPMQKIWLLTGISLTQEENKVTHLKVLYCLNRRLICSLHKPVKGTRCLGSDELERCFKSRIQLSTQVCLEIAWFSFYCANLHGRPFMGVKNLTPINGRPC